MRAGRRQDRDEFYSRDFEFFIDRRIYVEAHTVVATHWHDYCEMEFVRSGHGTHFLNGRRMELAAGSLYLLTPMDFHTVTCDPGSQMELYHIQFGSSVLTPALMQRITEAEARSGGGITATLRGAETGQVQSACEQLLEEFCSRRPDGVMMMRACLERLCIQVLRIAGRNMQTQAQLPGHAAENTAVNSAIQYVQYNFRSPLTLAEMAERVHLSANYFGELFHAHMGMRFSEYLRAQRLDYAHKLLSDTQLSVSEIARESGFRTNSHFTEAFRRRYGVTPTEFRRGKRAESEDII